MLLMSGGTGLPAPSSSSYPHPREDLAAGPFTWAHAALSEATKPNKEGQYLLSWIVPRCSLQGSESSLPLSWKRSWAGIIFATSCFCCLIILRRLCCHRSAYPPCCLLPLPLQRVSYDSNHNLYAPRDCVGTEKALLCLFFMFLAQTLASLCCSSHISGHLVEL